MMSNTLHAPAFVAVVLLISPLAADERRTVRVSDREQLVAALAGAEPGTTILIAPGTYRGGLSRRDLRGTPERPIVIAAADPGQPPLVEGGGSGVHLADPRHVELRDLIVCRAGGNGINIDDAGTKDTPARGITLVRLAIRDIGPQGNRDALKLSGVDDFSVTDCRFERWGSGGSAIDMVGCHQGTISECTFREGADGANGVQTKGGSSDVVIRRCRFEDAGGRAVNIGGSTGRAFFRPPAPGFEAARITVEDCTFVGSMTPVAFVGVDGALVRHNTLYRPTRWALRILQETRDSDFVPCRNGRFEHNIVAFHARQVRTTVNIGPGTAPETFTFSGNLWYCLDRPTDTHRLVQLPAPESEGTYGIDPGFANPREGDFRLRNAPGIHAGVRTRRQDSTDSTQPLPED